MRQLMKRMIIALALLVASAPAMATLLYGIDDFDNSLFSIDPVTLAVTSIGPTGVGGDFGDLAYDASSQTMYWVAGRGNNNLYTINLATGAATLIGPHGVPDEFTLGFDGTDLYGQSTNGNVYQFNTTTGAATLIGSNGVYPGSYDWNPVTGQMILLEAGGGNVYEINLSNGAATLLATSPGWINDNGFTYDQDRNVYWAIDWSNQLYQYDSAFNRTTILSDAPTSAALEYVSELLIEVAIDIKFCSDPNAFNCKKNGVLPVTIFGTADFDVTEINTDTLQLCLADGVTCTNAPRDTSTFDRGTPEDAGVAQCDLDPATGEELDFFIISDGFLDLDVAFEASEVQTILGDFCTEGDKGDVSEALVIIGETYDGVPIYSVPADDNTGIDRLVKKN